MTVYFADNGAGLIKIGYSAKPDARLVDLRTASPNLTIFARMDGTRGHERTIHDCLAIHRVKREWFKDCDDVREVIDLAIAGQITDDETDEGAAAPVANINHVSSADLALAAIKEAKRIGLEIERRAALREPIDDLISHASFLVKEIVAPVLNPQRER